MRKFLHLYEQPMEILFRCPRSLLMVQHHLEQESGSENEYEAVTCPACARIHFVSRKDGKLLGQSHVSSDIE
jgi:hypothetical protein